MSRSPLEMRSTQDGLSAASRVVVGSGSFAWYWRFS
jgi:hypothetical protein